MKSEDIYREISRLQGVKSFEEKKGIHAMNKQEREEASRKGGSSGGKKMSLYKWVTDGSTNSRIPIFSVIPEGWRNGVTRKKAAKGLKKFNSVKEWNEFQTNRSKEYLQKRLISLEGFDLNKRGAISAISRMWEVSPTQARRLLKKGGLL